MTVEYLKTKAEYDAAISTSTDELLVIFFTASWSPPCRTIEPKFEAIVDENTDVVFKKIDVDDNSEAATAAGI